MKRFAATLTLILHVLLAAAGPALDARVHAGGTNSHIAVAQPDDDAGARPHVELCGLCRTLQQIDAPPTTPADEAQSGEATTSSLPEPHLASASALRTSSLGARAPPA